VLHAWLDVLDARGREYELLIDQADAASLHDRPRNLRVLHARKGAGVGAVLTAGIKTARHPLLCYAPCDRRYDPADLKKLLGAIDAVHLVTSRRAGYPAPAALHWLGRVFRGAILVLFGVPLEPLPVWRGWRHRAAHWLLRLLFGLRIHDAPSGMKLFRKDILERLPVQSKGEFAHIELLAKANFVGYFMDEVTVSYPADALADHLPSMIPDARRVLADPEFGKS